MWLYDAPFISYFTKQIIAYYCARLVSSANRIPGNNTTYIYCRAANREGGACEAPQEATPA